MSTVVLYFMRSYIAQLCIIFLWALACQACIMFLRRIQVYRQGMATLGQRKQLVVEAYSASHEHDVVGYGPSDTPPLISWDTPLLIVFLVDIWWSDRDTSFDAYTTVEPRKSHPVAKGVC